jgi:branched-subunit amino acid transport protein AzlD
MILYTYNTEEEYNKYLNKMRKNIIVTIIVLLIASCSKDELPEPVRIDYCLYGSG